MYAPFPPDVKSKKDRCVYLDLLFRRAIASGREGIFWLTPEEFSVFNEDQHRTELLKALKEWRNPILKHYVSVNILYDSSKQRICVDTILLSI